MLPRGIRNKNPGNIDFNPANAWRGQEPHDKRIEPRFCRFSTHRHGIRALAKIISAYYHRHKLRTPRAIISRYAPPRENQTSAYAGAIATALNIDVDDVIPILTPLILSIITRTVIRHENGLSCEQLEKTNTDYSQAVINDICSEVLRGN